MCGESACLRTPHNEGPGFLFGGSSGCSPMGEQPEFPKKSEFQGERRERKYVVQMGEGVLCAFQHTCVCYSK